MSRELPRARPLFLLAVLSFVIYAATALRIHPAQDHVFEPERSSLAAAVSNVVYDAPLGTVYSGVLARAFAMTASTEQWLAEARQKNIDPGTLVPTIQDGNGIGYMLVADLAFRLFGTHIASVVFTLLLLLGISALAFLYRFPDCRAVVVILYFTSLTVMLFTPLVWAEINVTQIPIGGMRYFSLLALLPAFHLVLEFADSRGIERRVRDLAPLGVQVAMLVMSFLVRNSAGALIAAVALCALLSVWKVRRDRAAANRTWRKAGYVALIGIAFIGVLLLSAPRYLSEGRFTETAWHRVIVSFGLSPAWPFGNLREVYDCRKYIPEGLVIGLSDRNGHCIWLLYAEQHGISLNEVIQDIYGPRYDRAMRAAFLDIARLYPGEVFRTFTEIKVRYIGWSLSESLKFDFAPVPAGLIWMLAAALVNLLVCSLIRWPAASYDNFSLLPVTAVFAAFTIPPYIVAWAIPSSSADLLCLLLFATGLALFAAIDALQGILRRILAETARATQVAPIPPDTTVR